MKNQEIWKQKKLYDSMVGDILFDQSNENVKLKLQLNCFTRNNWRS